MKALKNLLGLARGDTGNATVSELAPTLPHAEAELVAAREAQAGAERAYTDALLVAGDAQLQALDVARREAVVRVDRAEALLVALRSRLAEAQAREAEAERVAKYQAAARQADEARKALAEFYPEFAAGLAELLRGLAEAEIAVANANIDLPEGVVPLTAVEFSVRADPGVDEEILAEETQTVWCRAGDLSHESVGKQYVKIDEYGRGYMQLPRAPVEYLVARQFVVTRYVPGYGRDYPYSLFRTLNLPGLRAGDGPFFLPLDGSRPSEALKQLDKLATAAGSALPRPPAERVRYTLIGTYDLDAETAPPKVVELAAKQA